VRTCGLGRKLESFQSPEGVVEEKGEDGKRVTETSGKEKGSEIAEGGGNSEGTERRFVGEKKMWEGFAVDKSRSDQIVLKNRIYVHERGGLRSGVSGGRNQSPKKVKWATEGGQQV